MVHGPMVDEEAGAPMAQIGHGQSLQRAGISASIYLFLVYFGVGMLSAPLTGLILQEKCALNGLDTDHCHPQFDGYDDAQRAASQWSTLYTLATGVLEMITCAFFGTISDACGRRYALMLPVLGMMLKCAAIAMVPGPRQDDVLLVCAFFASTLGGSFVTNHAAMSTLADCTQGVTSERRSSIFAMVEGFFFVGLATGPAMGGFVATKIGNRQTFLVMSGIHFVNLMITFFTYNETLEPERRRSFSLKRANPFASLGMFFETSSTTCMFGIMFLSMLSGGWSHVLGYYVMRVANFTVLQLGFLASVSYGASCVGLILVMPILARFVRAPGILSLSLLGSMVIPALLSVSSDATAIYSIMCMGIFTAMIFPVVRTGMTNTFGKQRYGEALAAVGTLEQTAYLISPLVYNQIYRSTVDVTFDIGSVEVKCVSFVVCSAVAMLGLIVSLFLKDIPKNIDTSDDPKLLA